MNAPPGVMGTVAPSSSFSSDSVETTAIAGSSSLSAPATSPTVAANNTSCPKPRSDCASPSSRATSVPTRITFATTGITSVSQALNLFQFCSANLDDLVSRRVAGHDAHIAPRDLQRLGKKIDQGLVRHSLYRRSCDPHLQAISLKSGDFVSGRARLQAN